MGPDLALLQDLEVAARRWSLLTIQEARDAAQMALERTDDAILSGKCDADGRRPYSFGCLKNVVRETYRKQTPTTNAVIDPGARVEIPGLKLDGSDAVVDTAWLTGEVKQCFDKLAAEEQALIQLRFDAEKTFEGLAGELNRTTATARRRVARVLGKLRLCLARLGFTADDL